MSQPTKSSVRISSLIRYGFIKPRLLLAFLVASIGIGTATFCFAVPASGVWAVAFSPTVGDSTYLEDVTCTSGSDCWAVGILYNQFQGRSVSFTLIEHWNGTEWTRVPSPNNFQDTQNYQDLGDNQLYGVACTSTSDCWAVGSSRTYDPNQPTPYQTLIEHWDGTSWTIVTSPNTNDHDNSLNGVACSSASDCWAVGNYYNGTNLQTLIEHWNGSAWTIVTSPNADTSQRNYFNDITCVSASNCWAVGAHNIDSTKRQPLIEHWNGTAWAIVPSANTGVTEDTRLIDVACPSASDCWAVGYRVDGSSNLQRTVTEHWNGTAWTIVASPNTSGAQDNDALISLTCASASDCWAVGAYFYDNVQKTLIEHWNGTTWKIVTSPNATNTSETYASLPGVACAAASDCWAVGWDSGALIEHYSTSNKLGNISTRLDVLTGNNVAIAGFIINGQPQKVLIRALGPTLAAPPFNVPDTLGDPRLVLYDHTQNPIASNDNWPNTIIDGTVITQDQEDAIYSSGYRPSSNNESVIITTLPAGNYTAIVSGVNNTTGVALVEVYDLTPTDSGNLTNISTRGLVTADDVMIGGFIVIGAGSRSVVVRALGPTLGTFGVTYPLADPTLELRDSNGNLITSNDNWKDTQQTEIQSSGLAPPNDLEAAILVTLPPANYTAILRAKGNTSGVALVETYVTN